MIVMDKFEMGSRLQDLRKARNMSAYELADKAEVSLPHLRKVEIGSCNMSIGVMQRIITALNIDPNTLFNYSKESVSIDMMLETLEPAKRQYFTNVFKRMIETMPV